MAFTPVQKLSITSGAALLLLAAVGVVAYLSTTQLVDAQRAAAATNLNIARLDRVLQRTGAADEAISRYAESGDRAFLSVIDAAQSDLEYALDSLRTATEDHPVQRRNLDSLGTVVGARLREIRQVALVREKVGHDSAAKLSGAGRSVARPTLLLGDMRNEEVRVLGERTRVMADSSPRLMASTTATCRAFRRLRACS